MALLFIHTETHVMFDVTPAAVGMSSSLAVLSDYELIPGSPTHPLWWTLVSCPSWGTLGLWPTFPALPFWLPARQVGS